jgi:hypothetical protein
MSNFSGQFGGVPAAAGGGGEEPVGLVPDPRDQIEDAAVAMGEGWTAEDAAASSELP